MMKKILLLLVIAAACFIACEEPNNPAEEIYTISFDANGGTGGPEDVTVAYGKAMPELVAEDVPAREEYAFTGYFDAESEGTQYYDSELTAAQPVWDKKEDSVLYAQWSPLFTMINFDANEGTGSMPSQKIPENTVAALTANEFTRIDYAFSGWAETAGGEVTYTDEADYQADAGAASVTLYAVWVSTTTPFTVSFNRNGGDGTQIGQVNAVYGQPMPALPAHTLTNENYSSDGYVKYYFDGYGDAETGGTKYYNADLSSAKNWDKTENTELFARWLTVAEKYNITLGTDDITAYFAETAPVIDGSGNDAIWAKAKWQPINYFWMFATATPEDFTGRFKIVWTADRLYILTEITDDIISTTRLSTPYTNPENDDCLEFFIDENASGGTRTSDGGNNFFTYHMSFGGVNVADYLVGGRNNTSTDDPTLRVQNNYILRNSHLNYKIDKNDATHMYIWETEMKVYDSTYPLNSTPDTTPVILIDGKKIGFAAAYCDADSRNTREHFYGSMFVTGNTDQERNQAYQNSTQYAKLYLVK